MKYTLRTSYLLSKICSKLIFKRLLLKLTTECTFMFTSDFYKQTDGYIYIYNIYIIYIYNIYILYI